MIDFDAIWNEVMIQFTPGLDSIHGPSHWRRVEAYGIKIAAETPGVDTDIIKLFAVLHDSRRLDDGADPLHGVRASQYARDVIRNTLLLDMEEKDFRILFKACREHADGKTTGDPTVGACWDADRLDLGRVGIIPDPAFMSTKAGRRMAIAIRQTS